MCHSWQLNACFSATSRGKQLRKSTHKLVVVEIQAESDSFIHMEIDFFIEQLRPPPPDDSRRSIMGNICNI